MPIDPVFPPGEDGNACRLCPRACGANRNAGVRGHCDCSAEVLVSRAAPHLWEEPCICTGGGSGTVFFSGCSLGCVYCQNREISSGRSGLPVSAERLCAIFLELQEKGVCNLELVTAGHFLPWVVPAVRLAKAQGLRLPVVYNTGSYERPEALRLLEGVVDVYLPDFKYSSHCLAGEYSSAPDYPEVAWAAVAEMVRQTGPCLMEDGVLRRGVLIRILLLPGALIDAKHTLHRLYRAYGNTVWFSLMRQYTPMPGIGDAFPALSRRVTEAEYHSFVAYARELGITQAFTQEAEAAEESFIPAFDHTGVLPEP